MPPERSTWPGCSVSRSRCRPSRSTPCTAGTPRNTASADGWTPTTSHPFRRKIMATSKPGAVARIGILGIMQDLYDDMIPGIAQRQEGYAAQIAAHLADVGEFIPSKPVKYREDAEREMRAFEHA